MYKKLKNEKYRGFVIGFGHGHTKKSVEAHFVSAPKEVGSVDTYRLIGQGRTKKDAFDSAKDTIDTELEVLERVNSYTEPRY